jgi:hypothetical protein
LYEHANFVTAGTNAALAAFAAQARWARRAAQSRGKVGGAYPYPFASEKYGLPDGWLSAMAQGEIVSLLLRAEKLFPGEGYGEAALAAAEPFRYTLAEGGVVWRSTAGDCFLEEYAGTPPSHVLNGHIFALWGLYELAREQGVPWVKDLAAEATETLRRRLPLYDSGYWSYYSLLVNKGGLRNAAVLKYHAFHIAQLNVMFAFTGERRFREIADRWQHYAGDRGCRARMIANTLAGLPARFVFQTDKVPGGAYDLLHSYTGTAVAAASGGA